MDSPSQIVENSGFAIPSTLDLERIYGEIGQSRLASLFYEYCLKKFPKVFKGLDTEKGPFWELAEIFNAIVQQTNNYAKLHGRISGIGDPTLEKQCLRGKKIWKGDIDKWIKEFAEDYVRAGR